MTNQDEWTEQELEGVSTTEIVRMLNEYQDMLDATRTYAHRNGESESPTEAGWYWALVEEQKTDDETGEKSTVTHYNIYPVHGGYVIVDEFFDAYVMDIIAFYGPIPVPTRKD